MTADQASEQAVSTGDVPTSQEGQLVQSDATMTPPVTEKPQEETPKPEEDSTAKLPNEEAKDWRKSDKKWQEAQEKAKKADALEEQVEEKEEEKKSLREKVESLEQHTRLLSWEKKHPIVDDERYAEEWQGMLKTKGHLVQSGELTYDDLWKLVSKEDSSSAGKAEAEQRVKDEGSVPQSSRTAPSKPGLDPETIELGKYWGNSPQDFEKYGIR